VRGLFPALRITVATSDTLTGRLPPRRWSNGSRRMMST
jgi:hypothetical protein